MKMIPFEGNLDDIEEQPAAPPPKMIPFEPDAGSLSAMDPLYAVKGGAGQLVRGVGWGMEQAGLDESGASVKQYGKEMEENAQKAMSPRARAELEKKYVEDAPEGEGVFGYKVGPALKSPAALALGIAGSIPSTLAAIPLTVAAAAALPEAAIAGVGATGAAVLGRAGVTIGAKAIPKLGAAITGAVVSGTAEGLVQAGMTGDQVTETVKAVPLDVLEKSERFRALRDQAGDPEKARDQYANELGREAAVKSGLATAALGAPMGAVVGTAARGFGKGAVGEFVKGTLGEGLQEAAQNPADQYFQNVAVGRADPNVKPTDNLVESAVAGFAQGAGMGGGSQLGAHAIGQLRPAPPQTATDAIDSMITTLNPPPQQPAGVQIDPRETAATPIAPIGGPAPAAFTEAPDGFVAQLDPLGVVQGYSNPKTGEYLDADQVAAQRLVEQAGVEPAPVQPTEAQPAPAPAAAAPEPAAAAPVMTPYVEDEIAEAPVAVTPEQQSAFAGLRAQLDRRGLSDVGLRLVDTLQRVAEGKASAADGSYLKGLITLARDNPGGEPGMSITLDHESVHAMKGMGLFTDAEWRTLSNSPGVQARVAEITQRYAGLDAESILEEAIADELAQHTELSAPGALRGILQKIGEFIRSLVGMGPSFQRVVRGFQTGEIGNRARTQSAAEPEAKLSLRGKGATEEQLLTHLRGTSEGEMTSDLQKLSAPKAKATLYKQLHALAKEGEAGKFWYERSGKAILDYFRGDTDAADKFAQLIAIYSPRNSVAGNTTMAIRAWNRFLGGKPVNDDSDRIGTADRDKKAAELLEQGLPFEGRKTSNFYLNLTRTWSNVEQGVTGDMWMGYAHGFVNPDLRKGNKYELVERVAKNIARELGWEPQQVQAAIWVATKARYEQAKGETIKQAVKKGWVELVPTDKGGKPEIVYKDIAKFVSLWRKNALGAALDPNKLEASIRDFSDFIENNLAQVSVEMIPGKTTQHLTGLHELPAKVRGEYFARASRAMLDENGRDVIAEASGLMTAESFDAPGYWQGASDASQQRRVATTRIKDAERQQLRDIDPQQRELLTSLAATYGLVQMQEGVGFHLAKQAKTKKGANAVEIDIGRPLTADEMVAMGKALSAAHPAAVDVTALVGIPNGVRVISLDDTTLPNADLHQAVKAAAEGALDADFRMGYLAADSALTRNDWSQDPYGQAYLRAIAGPRRPGLLRAAQAVLARLEAVDREFARRYGLGFRQDLFDGIGTQLDREVGDGGAKYRLRSPDQAEVPLAAPVSVDRLQPGPEAQREIYARFGQLDAGRDTTDRLKVYDLRGLTEGPARVDALLDRYGYRVKYFAFHNDPAAGVEFRLPKLKRDGYANGTLWLYDPRVANASFKDTSYTNAWRITHELGHALTEQFVEDKYGASHREGRLGQTSTTQRGVPPKQIEIEVRPLTLTEAQRAIEWEDVAFRTQRMLLEEAGEKISDADFAHEYNINISDAVYRTLTGEFGNPGEYGFLPMNTPADIKGILALMQKAEAALAKEQKREPTKGVDLKTWKPVSDVALHEAMHDAAAEPRDGAAAQGEHIDKSGVKFSLRAEPPFFSALTRAVEAMPQAKAPAEQWRNMIRNLTQKGVKSDEIAWSGVDDWLAGQQGSITKDAVVEQLRANEVQVEEVEKGGIAKTKKQILKTLAEWEGLAARRIPDDEDSELFAFWDATGHYARETQRNVRDGEDVTEAYGEFVRDVESSASLHKVADDDDVANFLTAIPMAFGDGGGTKFGTYVLPGGERYRELLLTMPQPAVKVDTTGWTIKRLDNTPIQRAHVFDADGNLVRKYEDVFADQPDLEVIADAAKKRERGKPYKSAHWDEPNILAHIRVDDRTDVDGKKTLFVEEIQSDWHQQGRRKGYATPINPVDPKLDERFGEEAAEVTRLMEDPTIKGKKAIDALIARDNKLDADINAAIVEAGAANVKIRRDVRADAPGKAWVAIKMDPNGGGGVTVAHSSTPGKALAAFYRTETRGAGVLDAPLKTQWPEMAFKRVLRMAAEEGYDQVAWTTGDQQNDRYDLAKHIDNIVVTKNVNDDRYEVTAYKDRSQVISKADQTPEQIVELVGKDVADRAISRIEEQIKGRPGARDFKLIKEEWRATKKQLDDGGYEERGEWINLSQAQKHRVADELRDLQREMSAAGTANSAELKGLDLRIGGEGMRGFYDKMLPSIANKLGKKWGAKAETTEIHTNMALSTMSAKAYSEVHAVPVTPQMRESVLQGQPLWSLRRERAHTLGFPKEGQAKGFSAERYPHTQWVRVSHPGKPPFVDAIKGLNAGHALARARVNWDGAEIAAITEDQAALHQLAEETGDEVTIEQLDKARGPLWALRATSVRGSAAQEAIIGRVLQFQQDVPVGQRIREAWSEIKTNGIAKFRQGMIDRFDAVMQLEMRENAGKLLDAAVSAYKAMRMTSNLSSVMHVLLKRGMIDYRGGEFVPSTGFDGGFEGIFKPLAEKGLLRLWQAWAVANRAQRLIREGREALMAQADIDELLKLGRAHPEFAQVLAKYQGFNARILDIAVKTGLMDPALRAKLQQNDYVPFYRVLDRDGVGGPGIKRGATGQSAGVLRLMGGEAMINDLFDNMTRNMARVVDASFKNLAATRTIDLAVRAGAAKRVPPDFKPVHVTASEMQDALFDMGFASDTIPADQKDMVAKLFTMVQPTDPKVVSVKRAGKTEYYEVTDPLLLAAFGPAHIKQNAVVEFGGKFSNALRKGVTALPDFMVANFLRDTMSAWVVSGGKTNPLKAVSGFMSALRNSPEAQEIAAAGAGGKGFYGTLPQDVARQMSEKVSQKQRNILHKAWDVWERVGQASEMANRIAVYKTLKKGGASNAEAAYQALDLMDFSMRGDFAAMRAVTTLVPFMNARVQGLYKLWRAAKQNPVGFWMRGSAIMLPSIALAMMNVGQDWYDDLSPEDRELYYHFKIGGQHLRVPKPFEVGALFSTAPELLVNAWYGTEYGKHTTQRAAAILLDQFNFNPTPQAIKPILDQLMNQQGLVGGRPIVPAHFQEMPKGQQYNMRTSELAKALGENTNTSPLRLDALMSGYFGSFGALVGAISTGVARAFSDNPAPAKRSEELPLVGRYVRGEPTLSTQWATSWSQIAGDARSIARGAKAFQEVGESDKAQELFDANPGSKAIAHRSVAVNKLLANLAKQEQRVQLDKSLSSTEKRVQLDELITRRNEVQRGAVEQARAVMAGQ